MWVIIFYPCTPEIRISDRGLVEGHKDKYIFQFTSRGDLHQCAGLGGIMAEGWHKEVDAPSTHCPRQRLQFISWMCQLCGSVLEVGGTPPIPKTLVSFTYWTKIYRTLKMEAVLCTKLVPFGVILQETVIPCKWNCTVNKNRRAVVKPIIILLYFPFLSFSSNISVATDPQEEQMTKTLV